MVPWYGAQSGMPFAVFPISGRNGSRFNPRAKPASGRCSGNWRGTRSRGAPETTRYANRSRIKTPKKPKAPISVHFNTVNPYRLNRGWPVTAKQAKDTTALKSSSRINIRISATPNSPCPAYQARANCENPAGARLSSSKVTMSQASSRVSSSRNSLLFRAWPERKAL